MEEVISHFLRELESAIPGRSPAKRDLLDEARDGLVDATEAYEQCGRSEVEAAGLALRDFGPVAVVAPDFRREVSMRQCRDTARRMWVTFVVLFCCWQAALASPGFGEPSATISLWATSLAGVWALTSLVGVVGFLATGRLGARAGATRGHLPRLIAGASIVGCTSSAAGFGLLLTQATFAVPVVVGLGCLSALGLARLARSGLECGQAQSRPGR